MCKYDPICQSRILHVRQENIYFSYLFNFLFSFLFLCVEICCIEEYAYLKEVDSFFFVVVDIALVHICVYVIARFFKKINRQK